MAKKNDKTDQKHHYYIIDTENGSVAMHDSLDDAVRDLQTSDTLREAVKNGYDHPRLIVGRELEYTAEFQELKVTVRE